MCGFFGIFGSFDSNLGGSGVWEESGISGMCGPSQEYTAVIAISRPRQGIHFYDLNLNHIVKFFKY